MTNLRCVFLFFICSFFSNAQDQVNVADLSTRPTAKAEALESSPTIDGEVIDDGIWKTIAPLSELSQAQPNFGQPASEKTEIKVAYTSSVFYVSAATVAVHR